MTDQKPTYRELEIEIQEAKEQILSLYRHEADAVVGNENVCIVRTRQMEEKIQQARRRLEQQVSEQSGELKKIKQELRAVLDENERMVRDLEKSEQALRDRARTLRQLSRQLGSAEEKERQRLAAILHDDIQQLMVGAKFHLEILDRFLDDDGRDIWDEIKTILGEAIDKTRTLSHELNPPVLRQAGLAAALRWLTENMWSIHRLEIDCDIRAEKEPSDEQIRAFVFRAVNELFFNIVKHAGVTRAKMEVASDGTMFTVTVSDEGVGFDPQKLFETAAAGLGLLDIHHRARTLGGRLRIESAPGQGTRFTLAVPLNGD